MVSVEERQLVLEKKMVELQCMFERLQSEFMKFQWDVKQRVLKALPEIEEKELK